MLNIPDADRGVTPEVLTGARELVTQVTAETYGVEAVGMVDGALRTSPPEFLWKQLTTEQKEALADTVDNHPARRETASEPIERWWR